MVFGVNKIVSGQTSLLLTLIHQGLNACKNSYHIGSINSFLALFLVLKSRLFGLLKIGFFFIINHFELSIFKIYDSESSNKKVIQLSDIVHNILENTKIDLFFEIDSQLNSQ